MSDASICLSIVKYSRSEDTKNLHRILITFWLNFIDPSHHEASEQGYLYWVYSQWRMIFRVQRVQGINKTNKAATLLPPQHKSAHPSVTQSSLTNHDNPNLLAPPCLPLHARHPQVPALSSCMHLGSTARHSTTELQHTTSCDTLPYSNSQIFLTNKEAHSHPR